ncbi:tyrosine-type recombinase/integrase [Ktedonobacter racemifer]|uniref:tyrosine-type recombinase/integrase n=1 Tax=Ktedonobacter racemifer TaxID=363277 RepID=UPI0012FACB0B|nr:tyrosine-type recombinase/integrase [Ktedonobacter racemifer]
MATDPLEWLAYLRNTNSSRGKPYSSRSILTYCRHVLIFFQWLFAHDYIAFNPAAKVKEPKVDKPLIRVFTLVELEKLDAACTRPIKGRSITPDERKMLTARDRAIFWLLLSTGIRLSELCGLRFMDVDWDNGMINVHGKGAKERRVPIGQVARQHLNTYITYWRGVPANTEEAIFISVFGKSVTPPTINQMFARLKRIADITDKRVSAHTCRHWFAVNCIKNGMPTIALKNLLGHETWEMIEVYVHLAEQDTRDLYVRYSPVDGLNFQHSTKDHRRKAREWRTSRKR